MIELNLIADAIQAGHIRITDHADEEAVADGISIEQILTPFFRERSLNNILMTNHIQVASFTAIARGRSTVSGRILKRTLGLLLITVYRPDAQRWINWRTRKPKV